MSLYTYASTDGSAPVLNDTDAAKTFGNMLNKCLVSGYGSKAAAGWTQEYTGGAAPPETRAFKMPASAPIRHYLEVESYYDTTVPYGYTYTDWQGWEAMTALSTGTNPYPATKTVHPYFDNRGAQTLDHAWWTWTDNRTLIVIWRNDPGGGAPYTNDIMLAYFGEFFSYKASDTSRMIMIAGDTTSASNYALGSWPLLTTPGGNEGWYYKDHTGTVAVAANVMCTHDMSYSSTGLPTANGYWGGVAAYPNGPDGSIYINPVELRETVGGNLHLRGRLRALWCTTHDVGNFSEGDIIIGSGPVHAGRQYLVFVRQSSGGTILPTKVNLTIVETTDTWETNG